MPRKLYHCHSKCVVSLPLKLLYRYHFVSHELNLDPTSLRWLQEAIKAQVFLLTIECLNDDSHEEVKEEKGDNDHKDDHVDYHKVGVPLNRLLVWSNGIHRAPHYTYPSFSALDCS